jgi:hypothetical protein
MRICRRQMREGRRMVLHGPARSRGCISAGPWCVSIITVLLFHLAIANAQLQSGSISMTVTPGQPVELKSKQLLARVDNPIAADVIDKSGIIHHVAGRYAAVREAAGHLVCTGALTCPGGSVLDFADEYAPAKADGIFRLIRKVTVRLASPADAGFRTEFVLHAGHAHDLSQVEPFVPGMWYCDAAHVPASGLISNPHQRDYLFREDRLPLPLAMFREKSSGLCATLIHDQPDGATFPGEYTARTVIDDRLKFASLGLRQEDGISVVLAYPGVEGDQTRMGRGRFQNHSAERFHPVRDGFSQTYRLLIHISRQPNFDDAMRDSWRTAFDAAAPPIVPIPMDRVYADSINLLDHFGGEYHGVPGFPFAVGIPDGRIRDVSMQMGFVGEQIPCGYHLITAGFADDRPALVAKGERIVDFWAANTLTPAGVPRTWYDVDPQPHWRDYKTFMRIATDGMEGMLQAWRRMQLNNRDKPQWLACCRSFGDWLVEHQNADGSYCRQYNFDGSILDPSKSAALHPVRFLVDLTHATGDAKFLVAAERAGRFALHDIGSNTNYFGGTADNADVKDKEAGWIALDSFLSLYESTGDRAWLAAAARAGTFTESWTYCWNIPIPADDPQVSLPPMKTTAGISLIATGHSGADVFLAFAPFAFYRLSLYTNDPHDAAMARVLLYDARQMVDVDGSLHYAVPGLMTEATNVAAPRGHGVGVWLPWCTAAVLDPMVQLQEVFGSMDLDTIDRMPIAQRMEDLRTYGQLHGFPATKAMGH